MRHAIPTFISIVEQHRCGTRFNVGVDAGDGLPRQGAEGYQLTWMNAKEGRLGGGPAARQGGYLHGVVDGHRHDPTIRPNMLFSTSLPNRVLDRDRWGSLVDVALEKLVTPVGCAHWPRAIRTTSRATRAICGPATRLPTRAPCGAGGRPVSPMPG
jgi:hypothetical protein